MHSTSINNFSLFNNYQGTAQTSVQQFHTRSLVINKLPTSVHTLSDADVQARDTKWISVTDDAKADT